MFIKNLTINNLRNIESANLNLHQELNYLFGDNGAGKTSVLESIVVLAKGRSFRSGQISSLLGPDAGHFRVVASTEYKRGNTQTLGIERSISDWKARRNGEDVKQLSDLASHLPLVLIEPNSHLLVSGPPEGRRRFLDWGVFHVEQGYLLLWRRYSRALKQRNAALRKQDKSIIESLDGMVSDLGEKINDARHKQQQILSGNLSEILKELSPDLASVKMRYDKGWKAENLLTALRDALPQDLDRGMTGPGPHKADVPVYLNNRLAKDRISRGEQKILSAALLLSQARLMAEDGETPILLMDDLASEFDELHLSRVVSVARELKAQIWITGTSYKPYTLINDGSYHMFHVEHGIIATETTS
ncbi:MAG: DNA replication and repair protein RecF [Lysobacterales bacterium]